MPQRVAQSCPQREAVEALAREELTGEERRRRQQHLETCEACRTAFRKLTAEQFPVLRNYTLLERVGEGGFGVVYKAVHHAKERIEAVKILFGRTAVRAAYFENEVHLIAKLRHPRIATLYEAHLNSPPLYYTMEFVEGRQLNGYLRETGAPLAERLRIIRAVAEAVGYAHAQGVIHRDLKPQNILMDDKGVPHIVDFGIAKRLGFQETQEANADHNGAKNAAAMTPESPEGMVGTLGFIAPEQAGGEAVDARADIYALGVLLAHCLTGETPRLAAQPARVVGSLRARHVRRADDLAAIVACCLQPLPEQRYSDCAALIEDIDSYLAGRPVRAREDQPPGDRVARIAALVLRNYPYTVQGAVVVCVAALFSFLFWRLDARRLMAGGPGYETALIGFTEKTLAALRGGRIGADLPELDPNNLKSWRLLDARLLERLQAASPRVVVFDYVYSDCRPAFDEALIRAIQASSVPVVVGANAFDVNGEPRICPHLRSSVHGVGNIASTKPGSLSGEYLVPLCIERGFAPPIPSLSVAALAAARFADSTAELHVEPVERRLQLRYRRRDVPADAPRWRRDADQLPIAKIDAAPDARMFQPGDRVAYGRVPAARWAERMIPYEEVLTADEKQLRQWFGGRAVVVGQMIAGQDQHAAADGRSIFGCEVQTQAVAALPSLQPFRRWDLIARIGLWCGLVWGLARLLPTVPNLSLWFVFAACATACVGRLALGGYAALHVTDPFAVEILIGLSIFLATGGGVYAIRMLRERQSRLTPEMTWGAEETALATTVLAPPRG